MRGEEVVSLGWCFWHRVCFGCLICGTSLDLPLEDKDDEGELRWIDDDDPDEVAEADSGHADRPDRGRTRRQRGVELESVPLCSWCENATEGLYMDELLEMGLKNVTRKDDGLSKSRLDMLKRTKSKDAAQLQQTPRTLIKGKRQGQSSEDEPEGRANPLAGAVDMGIGEDENGEGTSNCCSPVESIGSMASPIYVSVLDAIGEPSFRASKTKPLPRWMTFLPGNRQQTFEQNDTGRSSPETRTPVHGLNSIIEPQDSCHTLDTAATVPGLSSLEQLSQILDNGSDTTVCSKMEDAAAFEPVISKDSRFEISNCHTSSDYQWRHPQRNATPCPFKRAAYRLPLNLSIPRSLFPRPLAETTMPAMPTPANEGSISTLPSQVTPHLFFRDEGLRKRDVSRDTEPIVERFKRPKTECDTSAVGEKNESGKEIDYAVQSGYIDKRDVLRMELLRLFNECREPSQEQ